MIGAALGDNKSHETTVTTVRVDPCELSTHDAEIEGAVLPLDAEEFGVYAEVKHGL